MNLNSIKRLLKELIFCFSHNCWLYIKRIFKKSEIVKIQIATKKVASKKDSNYYKTRKIMKIIVKIYISSYAQIPRYFIKVILDSICKCQCKCVFKYVNMRTPLCTFNIL